MAIVENLKVNVETDTGAKSLKQLKQEFKETQSALNGLSTDSKEYTDTLKKLAHTKDEIDDLNDSIKSMQGAGKFEAFSKLGASLSGGFQAATGAAALFGTKSEEIEKTLVKLQAAMALTQGIKELEGLGDAFKNVQGVVKGLWATLMANPFALVLSLIAGVAALAAGIKTIVDSYSDEAQAVKKAEAELERYKKTSEDLKQVYDNKAKIIQSEVELMKAQGKSQDEITKKIKEENEAKIHSIEIAIEIEKREMAVIEAKEKEIIATDDLLEASLRFTAQTSTGITRDLAEKELQSHKLNRLKEQVDKTAEAMKKIANAETDLQVLKNNIQTQGLIQDKANSDAATEIKDKEAKIFQEFIDYEIDADRKKARAEIDVAQKKLDDEKANAKELLDFKNTLQIKEVEDVSVTEKKISDEKEKASAKELKSIQTKLNTTKSYFDAVSAVSNAFDAIQQNNLKNGEQQSVQSQKRAFERHKALSIVGALINGAEAVTSILAQYPKFDGGIAMIAAISASAITTAAQIATIASQHFNAQGGTAGGSVNGNVGSFSQPSITQGVNNTSTKLSNQGQPVAQPQKVYVTQVDISNSNKKVNGIISKSIIK